MRRALFGILPLFVACSASNAGHGGGASVSDQDGGAGGSSGANSGGATDGGSDAAQSGDAGRITTTIRVHYAPSDGSSHTMTLRGSTPPLTWSSGAAYTTTTADTFTYASTSFTAPVEYKPMLDDQTWSRGPNYKISPGQTVDIYPHFIHVAGHYEVHWPAFTSTVLPSTRGIVVYYPPTYDENLAANLGVLYMHDGQNLFDPATAFNGNEWKVDETMDAAAEDGSIEETLVVGLDNDADRTNEYTQTFDSSQNAGGKGNLYLQMIVQEVKPLVDSTFRTIPTRESTAMLGSSLGGLISAYAGTTHADVFGVVGAMSPSTWWDNECILSEVGATPVSPRPIRVYVDSGDSGTDNDDVTLTAQLAAQYRAIGYTDGSTLDYLVAPGAQHSEIYWAARLPATLAFMLGPGR